MTEQEVRRVNIGLTCADRRALSPGRMQGEAACQCEAMCRGSAQTARAQINLKIIFDQTCLCDVHPEAPIMPHLLLNEMHVLSMTCTDVSVL